MCLRFAVSIELKREIRASEQTGKQETQNTRLKLSVHFSDANDDYDYKWRIYVHDYVLPILSFCPAS